MIIETLLVIISLILVVNLILGIIPITKKPPVIVAPKKLEWTNDSALLNNMIGRKVNPVIKFYIEVFSEQKNEKDLITDDELNDIYDKTALDTYEALNQTYIDYLETHYLGKDKVIEYIAEEVYYLLSISAIGRNNAKIDLIMARRKQDVIRTLNQER